MVRECEPHNFDTKTTFFLTETLTAPPVLGFLIFLSFSSLNSKVLCPKKRYEVKYLT